MVLWQKNIDKEGGMEMDDTEERREIPRTWKDYLASSRETGRVFKWVWKELADNQSRHWLKRLVITLVIAVTFRVIQPRLASYIFDGVAQREMPLVILGLAGFFVCLAAEKITDYYEASAREWLLGISWGNLDRRITELFFEKSLGQHIQESSTLNVANIDKGRWKLLELHAMLLFDGIPSLLSLFFSYLLLWWLSWVAGLIITAVMGMYLCWMVFLNQRVVEVCTPIDREFRRLNRHRVERWEKIERVETSGKEAEELAQMTDWFDKTISQDRNFWLWFIKHCIRRETASIVGLIAIMGYGAWLVWQGDWSIGLLYPLYSWSQRVCDNIWRIGHIEHQLNWNMPAVRSMINALSIPPDVVEREDATPLSPAEPLRVVFDGISHTYPIGGREERQEANGKIPVPVLKNVSFEIRPGEKVALIGQSGAGKTTLMRLLLRFMDPDKGAIKINGCRLCDLKRSSWMRIVGYIPQQEQVFDGTIRYNLTYGLSSSERRLVTDDELWSLMRLLRIDFGDRLLNGLETVVGRNGVKLSGGEAQRLMIGAAAIKKPRFMVIDEATSNLDSSTEKAVQAGLAEVLRGDVGALVVAHRLSTVRNLCDTFVVLKNSGEVGNGESQVEAVESSFEKLYETSPTFRQLVDDQGIIIQRS